MPPADEAMAISAAKRGMNSFLSCFSSTSDAAGTRDATANGAETNGDNSIDAAAKNAASDPMCVNAPAVLPREAISPSLRMPLSVSVMTNIAAMPFHPMETIISPVGRETMNERSMMMREMQGRISLCLSGILIRYFPSHRIE